MTSILPTRAYLQSHHRGYFHFGTIPALAWNQCTPGRNHPISSSIQPPPKITIAKQARQKGWSFLRLRIRVLSTSILPHGPDLCAHTSSMSLGSIDKALMRIIIHDNTGHIIKTHDCASVPPETKTWRETYFPLGETVPKTLLAPSRRARGYHQWLLNALTLLLLLQTPDFSMATTYQIPVPKQKHPELTRDQRLRVQTLFFDANYTRDQICLQTGYTYDQVCYAISHRLTPQKHKTGRRVILNTPQRKKLIQ
jgi:hypothetical protein